jgi:hypothetical protein
VAASGKGCWLWPRAKPISWRSAPPDATEAAVAEKIGWIRDAAASGSPSSSST